MTYQLLALLLPLLVYSCTAIPVLAADTTKPVTIAIIQEFSQFNPVNNNLASTGALMHFSVRDMIQRDSSGKLIPDIATDIPTVKNKKVSFITEKGIRKVVAEWSIRPTANWGDGKPVTCADWHLGWTVGSNDNVSVSERSMYKKVEKIEWKETTPKLCKVTYVNDSWTFDRELPSLLPKHLEASVFEKFKDKAQAYDQNSVYVKDPTNPGLYNGPYVVSEFQLGSHFVLKPNAHFYGDKASINGFIVKHVGDTSALKAQMATGAIDIVSANGFPADTAIQLDQESKKPESKFQVKFQASPIFQGLFLNLDTEHLKESAVRKALSMSINKQELSQAFFQGKLTAAETIFPETSPWHQTEKASFNPKEAKKVLEAAGWKLNSKNIFEKNGKELVLEFTTSAGIKILETVQTFICNDFQKIGIKCIAKNSPPRVFLGTSIQHGEFTMGMFGQNVNPDTSLMGVFASHEIPSDKNGFAGGNVSRWKNAKADSLLKEFEKEWDAKKRTTLMRALEQEIIKDAPLIPIYHRKEAFILPKNLKGFTEDISGVYFTFPEKWRLE